MKPPNAEQPWICQLCGKVKERPEHHVNSHRHKTSMKKIEDAISGEPIYQEKKDMRWSGR